MMSRVWVRGSVWPFWHMRDTTLAVCRHKIARTYLPASAVFSLPAPDPRGPDYFSHHSSEDPLDSLKGMNATLRENSPNFLVFDAVHCPQGRKCRTHTTILSWEVGEGPSPQCRGNAYFENAFLLSS